METKEVKETVKSLRKRFIKAFLIRSMIPFAILIFILVALYEMKSSLGAYKTGIVGTYTMPEAAEPMASIELLPNLSDSVTWPLGSTGAVGDLYKTWAVTDADAATSKSAALGDNAGRVTLDWVDNQKWLAELLPGEDAYEYAKAAYATLGAEATPEEIAALAAKKKKALLREMQLDVKNFYVSTEGGSTTTVVSETGLKYMVRIRSLGILPLDFTLVYTNADGTKSYYKAEKSSGTNAAEYIFHEVLTKVVNEKTVEYTSADEAVFYMSGPADWTDEEREAGGKQITDSLKIYVGWKDEAGAYDASLRKEVDRLRVLVNVMNTSAGDSDLPEAAPTIEESTAAPSVTE